MKTIVTCLLIFASIGCKASGNNNSAQDISSKEIYDFMQMVIKDQKLNTSLAIDSDPAPDCNGSIDSIFLNKLLIDSPAKEANNQNKTDTGSVFNFNFSVTYDQLEKCLSHADIDYMLRQRAKLISFKWDPSRLGFSKKAMYNYYYISAPVFSVDKMKAVLKIEELCPGLCGTGYTVLFIKKNGKWTSQQSGVWFH